jgi:archaellum component FlaC
MNDSNILSAKNKEGEIRKDKIPKKYGTIRYVSKELEQTKLFHGDEDIIFNINSNPNYIKKDLLLFKDEILKEIKIFNSKLTEKSKNNEKYMNDKTDTFSIQIEEFKQKIIELSNLIVTDKAIREKVNQIAEFKEKAQETIMTDGIKINMLEKDFYENIYRIDNILKDTVLNTKIIGNLAKYNTFYDFMSKVTDELSQLNTFKDKTISDLNNYGIKFDNYVNKTKLKIENGEKETKLYTDKLIKKIEIKMNDLFGEYNNRLNEIKFQNITLNENLKKITEDLLSQINNVKMIKSEIYNKFEEYTKIIKKENSKVLKSLEGYKEEFYNIKKKYKEISNHIKYKSDLKNINFELKSA